jgi:hypothetical protein
MEATIDSVGRIVVPKPLRDAEHGVLVATGETIIDDEAVFGLIDAGRR